MTITQKDVRTTYRINFSLVEFIQICQAYQTSMNKHHYPRAFENLNILDEIKVKEVESFFKEMGIRGNGDLFSLIANHFGFDGWSNAGYYNESKQCYCMSVFDHGDTLN